MKIIDVRTIFADKYLFVQVETDNGLVGVGESGAWGYLEASSGAVETFKRYLIGQDPLRTEHHWQYLYRRSQFRGAAIMGALSAIDIALWDIAGKHFGVPCYQLLGGAVRDKVRVYRHVIGATKEALVQGCLDAKHNGYTAVGHLTPFLDDSRHTPYFVPYAEKMRDATETVRRYREAVGTDVDLCVELHRRLTPAEAVTLIDGIAETHPYFVEDPVRPDNLDAMAYVASKSRVPIATGERLHTLQEFAMLLERRAAQYIRPDVCLVGGLTHAKKIAALAEAHYVEVVPHNPLSPVSTAACVQLAACIPNFAIQEYPHEEEQAPVRNLVVEPLTYQDGFLSVPDAPGIGVVLADDAADVLPYKPLDLTTRLHIDGSVIDQ